MSRSLLGLPLHVFVWGWVGECTFLILGKKSPFHFLNLSIWVFQVDELYFQFFYTLLFQVVRERKLSCKYSFFSFLISLSVSDSKCRSFFFSPTHRKPNVIPKNPLQFAYWANRRQWTYTSDLAISGSLCLFREIIGILGAKMISAG